MYISSVIKECYKKKSSKKLTTSDKIDQIVTNRWAALPIIALVTGAFFDNAWWVAWSCLHTIVRTLFSCNGCDQAGDEQREIAWQQKRLGACTYTVVDKPDCVR